MLVDAVDEGNKNFAHQGLVVVIALDNMTLLSLQLPSLLLCTGYWRLMDLSNRMWLQSDEQGMVSNGTLARIASTLSTLQF